MPQQPDNVPKSNKALTLGVVASAGALLVAKSTLAVLNTQHNLPIYEMAHICTDVPLAMVSIGNFLGLAITSLGTPYPERAAATSQDRSIYMQGSLLTTAATIVRFSPQIIEFVQNLQK